MSSESIACYCDESYLRLCHGDCWVRDWRGTVLTVCDGRSMKLQSNSRTDSDGDVGEERDRFHTVVVETKKIRTF